MADPNCGKLDLSKISPDEMFTVVQFNDQPGGKNIGTAYIRAEVDENIIVILNGRPQFQNNPAFKNPGMPNTGTYCVVKFNEGCFVDMCNDVTDFNPSITLVSNLIETTLSNAQNPVPEPAIPEPDENGNRNVDTSSMNNSVQQKPPRKTICGVNEDLLKVAQAGVDAHNVNDFGFQPAAIFPELINIPFKSNVSSYGPYFSLGFNNVIGGTEIINDADICPWNFGSNIAMNASANALVNNMAMGLKKAETGSITKAGLPIIANLGAAIANGPYLTNMTVSFGSSGITTNYEFSTFNPKVSAIGRLNIERIKELRKLRQEQLRLLRADVINQNRINQKLNRIRHQQKLEDQLHRRVARQASLQRVLVGELYPFALTDMTDNDIGQRSVVGMSTLSKSVAEMVYDYEKKAYMSLDGLFGPVSKNGDGNLPQYSKPKSSTNTHKSSPVLPQPPIQINTANPCSANIEYNLYNLDLTQPYFDPLTNKFTNHKYHTGSGAGHVIDMVGRNEEVSANGLITNFFSDDSTEKYSEDYRFLAMRGPLVLHSWGYDLNGKPIPNEADTVTNTKNGKFVETGLKDKFMKDWLRKPASWPVAPVDLRFDRKRGVWVSPQPYKIVVLKIIQEVAPFGSGKGILVNYGDAIYDSEGNEITTDENYCCGGFTYDCNWIDVVTNVCLTPEGLVVKKQKVRVSDINDADCCTQIIPTSGCTSSSSSLSEDCDCQTIECSSSSSSLCDNSDSTPDGVVEIEDRIGRRHRVGCHVYAYYDTSTSVYIVLQN